LSSPHNKGGGYTLARQRKGGGVNILEDDKSRIGLLTFISKSKTKNFATVHTVQNFFQKKLKLIKKNITLRYRVVNIIDFVQEKLIKKANKAKRKTFIENHVLKKHRNIYIGKMSCASLNVISIILGRYRGGRRCDGFLKTFKYIFP
jgi:hypothetical protein